jgi:hypothetical protein
VCLHSRHGCRHEQHPAAELSQVLRFLKARSLRLRPSWVGGKSPGNRPVSPTTFQALERVSPRGPLPKPAGSESRDTGARTPVPPIDLRFREKA